jgi:hypothetical protein
VLLLASRGLRVFAGADASVPALGINLPLADIHGWVDFD